MCCTAHTTKCALVLPIQAPPRLFLSLHVCSSTKCVQTQVSMGGHAQDRRSAPL